MIANKASYYAKDARYINGYRRYDSLSYKEAVDLAAFPDQSFKNWAGNTIQAVSREEWEAAWNGGQPILHNLVELPVCWPLLAYSLGREGEQSFLQGLKALESRIETIRARGRDKIAECLDAPEVKVRLAQLEEKRQATIVAYWREYCEIVEHPKYGVPISIFKMQKDHQSDLLAIASEQEAVKESFRSPILREMRALLGPAMAERQKAAAEIFASLWPKRTQTIPRIDRAYVFALLHEWF